MPAKTGIVGILIQVAVPRWDSWAGDAKDPQRLPLSAMLADNPIFCAMAQLAPSARLGQAHRVPVLLQFAENDKFISPAQATEFGDAVAQTATVQLIPKASHEGISKSGKGLRWEFLNRFLVR